MSASRRLVALALAASALSAVLGLACAGDEDGTPFAPREGGVTDASPDADAAVEDAETPLGDPCGDTTGLLSGAAWPVRGGCPKRASYAARRPPTNATLKWSVAEPASTDAVVEGSGLAWVGTEAGRIVGVSPSGSVVASLALGGAIRSTPALAASVVVVVATDGELVGVRRGSGIVPGDAGADAGAVDAGEDAGDSGASPTARVVFRLAVPGLGGASSPVIGPEGLVYVGTTAGLVAAAADGAAIRWTADAGDTTASSPAIGDDGTIYVGNAAGALEAFDGSGARVFRWESGASGAGSPAVGPDGTVYIATADGALHAVTSDGKPRWRATVGVVAGAPAVRAGTVYVGSADGKIHALAAADGTETWAFTTLGAVAAPSVSADGNVLAGSADGKLYVVAPSGLLVYAANVRGAVRGGVSFSGDGTVVVPAGSGIVAVGP